MPFGALIGLRLKFWLELLQTVLSDLTGRFVCRRRKNVARRQDRFSDP